MAKKSEITISNLSVKRAIKTTLLFMVRHEQWEELDYYRRLPEIKVELEELIEKGFLVSKGKKSILTGRGQGVTELFRKSRKRLETIFYSFVPPVENTGRKIKKGGKKNDC